MDSLRAGILTLVLLGLNACVGAPPQDDYLLAHTALNFAKAANAAKYAPGLLAYAERDYQQALKDYQDRNYEMAKNNFTRARQFAEKAEGYSVVKRAQLGESE